MMNRLLFACALLLGACATQQSSTSPQITGDTCALHVDATTCNADDACVFLGTGCACPVNDPSCSCPAGSCVSKSGSGSGSSGSGTVGSGSASAACVCPGGDVCYEQIGGPAQMAGTDPTIACTMPAPGSGDPCARVQGEGTCHDSDSVSGLCVCDNGIR